MTEEDVCCKWSCHFHPNNNYWKNKPLFCASNGDLPCKGPSFVLSGDEP